MQVNAFKGIALAAINLLNMGQKMLEKPPAAHAEEANPQSLDHVDQATDKIF
jgi:hypothetical protein